MKIKLFIMLLILPNVNIKAIESNSKEDNIKLIPDRNTNKKKDWLVLIYMAANNDLYPYAARNIREAAKVSCQNCHILVQTAEPGNRKTKRYLIEEKKITLLNPDEKLKLDSGSAETVIDFVSWSVKNYPSDYIMLDFWNHGTGCLDPDFRRNINPIELFKLNPNTMMLELDRSRGYMSHFEESRGICFDESYGSYLNNKKIKHCLDKITKVINKKINIVGFDACLMSMIETASIISEYSDYMVSSQEVELGTGWRYDLILKKLENNNISPESLANHIVNSYTESYKDITNDYTLSAIKLSNIEALKNSINNLISQVIDSVKNKDILKKTIRSVKAKCCFDEPSYVDILSLTSSLVSKLTEKELDESCKVKLREEQEKLEREYFKTVTKNTSGPNVLYATGISIYLPERRIHKSYKDNSFYLNNTWGSFLDKYISL